MSATRISLLVLVITSLGFIGIGARAASANRLVTCRGFTRVETVALLALLVVGLAGSLLPSTLA